MSNAEIQLYTGTSGGFNITWTTQDIIVRSAQDPSHIVFSAKAIAEQSFEDDTRVEEGEDPLDCDEVRTFTLLSVVGPLISYLDEAMQLCLGAAHAIHAVRFTTLNLSETDLDGISGLKQVRLDNLFNEADLLRGFLADPIINQTIQDGDLPAPHTLRNLVELIESGDPLDLGSEGVFSAHDALRNFAFHHLEANRVAIRICITPSMQAEAGAFSQLGILLPIPQEIEQPLQQADLRNTGFLMKDHRNVSGNRNTRLTFTSGNGAGLFDSE